MTNDERIKYNIVHYDMNREAEKISALSSDIPYRLRNITF